jgi:hypothetical protein
MHTQYFAVQTKTCHPQSRHLVRTATLDVLRMKVGGQLRMQRSDIPQNKLIRYNLVSLFHAVRMIQYLYSIPKQYLGPALVLLAVSSSAVALGALSIPWSNL